MSGEIIQAQYETLTEISRRFSQQASQTGQLNRSLIQVVNQLAKGGWIGKGSAQFLNEMERDLFPALQRLQEALNSGGQVTLQIKNILEQAEQEAAAPFKAEGAAASVLSGVTNYAGETSGPNNSGPFRIGPPEPPTIHHDDGFLGKYSAREPTLSDHAKLAWWRSKLEISEAIRPDLADANAAYRHFLDGKEADRYIDYERFVTDDPAGRQGLHNLIREAQRHAEVISQGRNSFSITSDAYNMGGSDPRFPYPQTENWEKTLGGHNVWVSADVQVTGVAPNRTYTMETKLHMEDRYNFNPGQKDIATGIPDSANGNFEITGLGHQYMNYGEVTRVVTWKEGDIANAQVTDQDPSRNRRPSDNRRLRNQI